MEFCCLFFMTSWAFKQNTLVYQYLTLYVKRIDPQKVSLWFDRTKREYTVTEVLRDL